MSRIIAASILIFMLAGLCVADRIVIDNAYNEMYSEITACEAAKGTENADKAVSTIRKNWENREGLLSVFVNHDILDEIGVSVARLEALKSEADEDYLSECAVIKLKLDYIKKDSGINMHSIF